MRLVDGTTNSEGRVEIYHDSEWGTICDDGWGIEEGITVCKQLGYSSALSVQSGAYFGSGSGVIWLDDVDCNGSDETRLDGCSRGGWGVHDCTHQEDVGVRCSQIIGESITRIHVVFVWKVHNSEKVVFF